MAAVGAPREVAAREEMAPTAERSEAAAESERGVCVREECVNVGHGCVAHGCVECANGTLYTHSSNLRCLH